MSEKNFSPCPEEGEIDYLVKELKNYFKMDEALIRNNITSQWSGNRPLFGESDLDNNGKLT
jgi:glycerol-3-phosphate dehydrogenase